MFTPDNASEQTLASLLHESYPIIFVTPAPSVIVSTLI